MTKKTWTYLSTNESHRTSILSLSIFDEVFSCKFSVMLLMFQDFNTY